MWSEKHRPKRFSEMVGNEDARKVIVEWIKNWKTGTKPILLIGPPGIGKTTIAKICANEFGYDLVELNASDVRNKQKINETLLPLLSNLSVLGKPLIFIDEVDGIHGRADFGGVEALVNVLKEPSVPIILAANSENKQKMKNIKKVTKTVTLRPVPPRLLQVYLEHILRQEVGSLTPGTMHKMIKNAGGDLRSLLNTVQGQVSGFEPVTDKSFEQIDLEEGVNSFFKSKTLEEARAVLYSMRVDPTDKLNAIYSSVINSSISNAEYSRMLQIISEADLLYGKIRRTQQWRLLRYLDNILAGLFRAEDQGIRYSQFSISWNMLNKIRWHGKLLKKLMTNLAKTFHVSTSDLATFYFPYIVFCIKRNSIENNIGEEYVDLVEKEMEKIS